MPGMMRLERKKAIQALLNNSVARRWKSSSCIIVKHWFLQNTAHFWQSFIFTSIGNILKIVLETKWILLSKLHFAWQPGSVNVC